MVPNPLHRVLRAQSQPLVAAIACEWLIHPVAHVIGTLCAPQPKAAHDLHVQMCTSARLGSHGGCPDGSGRAGCVWISEARGSYPASNGGSDEGEEHLSSGADADPHLQEGSGTGSLEAQRKRTVCSPQDVPHLPLVRPTWSQAQGGRPADPGRLLCRHRLPDEPELQALSLLRHRVSQCLRPGSWGHRVRPDGSRHLLLRRLLCHDGHGHVGDLRPHAGGASEAARRPSSCKPIRFA